MLAIVNSAAIVGIDALAIRVEVDVSNGLPAFDIVGLPDAAVKESRDRVRTAIKNSGFEFPLKRITVNLSPADIKKEGASFDLPIALGLLLATNQLVPKNDLSKMAFVGELSLDGLVQQICGGLNIGLLFMKSNINEIVLPKDNTNEVAILEELNVYGVENLRDTVSWLNGEKDNSKVIYDENKIVKEEYEEVMDMSDIRGQEAVKRAMEIAAAGAHNILMIGPPGSGKTMIARRMPTIIPEMTMEERIEITKIFSAAGMLHAGSGLMEKRPFRSPHHGASAAAVIGGGRIPAPGEISLAHNGILFLDELPEFHRDVLEALRQPLEDKVVSVSRVQGRMEFPARFQLVAAMNPCPCGHFGDPFTPCKCTPLQVSRYMNKISGPLLDRIDLHINVQRVEYEELADKEKGESSEAIRKRVSAARKIQLERLKGTGLFANGDMDHQDVEKYCVMSPDAENILKMAFERMHLSARAHDCILKVARTIADLDKSEIIEVNHIAEAIQYRSLDKRM